MIGLRCLAAAVALGLSAPAVAQVRFGNEAGGVAELRVTTYRDIPFRSVVRQEHDYSCGSAAVATLLSYHYGDPLSETEVFRSMYEAGDKARIEVSGFSLLEIKQYLSQRGYAADGFRIGYDRLVSLNAPAIAMIDSGNYRHFVVVKGATPERILIGDPATGLKIYTRAEFEKSWNGVAFLIRDQRTNVVFNSEQEWRPFAPTPWNTAHDSVRLEAAQDVAPLYQIAPIFNLDTVLP